MPTEEDTVQESGAIIADARFLQFLEANAGGDMDPLSDSAIKLQAQYVAQIGTHPMDVLKAIVANPFVKPSDRVNAAKILMEYGARKVPATLEVESRSVPIKLTAEMLAALTDEELQTMQRLLQKTKHALGSK